MRFVGNRYSWKQAFPTPGTSDGTRSIKSKNMEALTTKLEQLKLAVSRTESIIAQQNEVAIERHLSAVKTLSMEADNLKRAVEEQKLAEKEDLEEVNKWNDSVDTKIFAADKSVKILKDSIEKFRQRMQLEKQEQELDFEKKLFETKMKFQTELQQAKEKSEGAKIQHETTAGGSVSGHDLPAKLPKLQIARFNGSYEDWPRFWNQFVEIIDKATMPGVTKFAYLKSFLDLKVKHSVEGLPFSNEGYNRAKSILLDKYGKDSEIIKAYSQQIFDLPVIPNQNLYRIHEFCDKLTFSVQSLQTMGKLEQVNGYVAMTLDKLPAIRGNLVRTDPLFENWTFDKLAEALRHWTRRNPIGKTEDRSQRDDRNRRDDRKRDKPPFRVYNTQQKNGASKPSCVYCDATEHKSFNCTNVLNLAERRSILLRKRLCFNCTGPHKAENCSSKMACQKCNKKHHTSICDSNQSTQRSEGLLTAH